MTGGKALAAYMTERRVPTPSVRARRMAETHRLLYIAGLFARRLRELKFWTEERIAEAVALKRSGRTSAQVAWEMSCERG